MELRDRQLQEKNALKVRIGGLSPQWDTNGKSFEDSLISLNQALHPIHFDSGSIRDVSNKHCHDKGERIASGQAVIAFKTREAYLKELQSTRLLKGTSLWIAEELTPIQLKHKKKELEKMHAARREGKWAVFRSGKAIIQEFRTPKPVAPPPLDTPSTP